MNMISRMKNMCFRFLLITLCGLAVLPVYAEKKVSSVDHLGVAAVLIRDGNYERAMQSLEKVDLSDDKVDKARYYTLLGLVQLRRSLFEDAVGSFKRAIAEGQNDPALNAYIAQGYFALGNYEETIRAINRLPGMNQFPDLYGMKSQSFWFLGSTVEAFAILEKGITVFPRKKEFLQQKIVYLLELELNQEAAEISKKYISLLSDDDAESYISISQALLRAGEKDEAVFIMEMARLRFRDNQRVRLGLAQVYAQSEKLYTAASLVEEAALYDPDLYVQSAELYRRAGKLDRALYLNSLVTDQKQKIEQRFNIFLDQRKFENAYALEERMRRYGSFEDDAYGYAFAYVLFQLQKYDEAVTYLNAITSATIFRDATQLRQAIEIMKNEAVQFFYGSGQ